MDTIRFLAQSKFSDYDRFQKRDFHQVHSSVLTDQANIAAAGEKFQESESRGQIKPQLLTIKASMSGESTLSLQEMDDEHMLKHLSLPESQGPGASLSLIVVPYNTQNWSFDTSKATFLKLFELCALDPAALDPIRYPAWGMHIFRQPHHCATYYLGSVLGIMCWSFDPRTATTRGIVVPRSTLDTGHAKDTLARLVKLLTLQKEHIHTPHTLTFVQLIDLVSTVEELLSRDLTKLAQIERMTGHGLWTRSLEGPEKESDPSRELAWLKEASKVIGNKSMNNSRYTYLLDIVEAAVRDVRLDDKLAEGVYRETGPEQQQYTRYQSDAKYRLEAFQNLERRASRLRPSLIYHSSRFSGQATVIASLISHADARTGMKIAEASMETAEAARKDASAMKTLAVITMLFLPATFLAAVFAMPSLQWDKDEVIGPRFWIFWAIAVPLTVVVFIAWFVLNRQTGVSRRPERNVASVGPV
ncbi:hypothetical protein ISF_06682 [Cordyceps fumosorosea ARSEF 2679]|uniref:Mg2+ transporter protein, CorA-like/Zinc transport protein ZntB n=1 Tax=Cordyceps fumosorosea (strain ARSEF 2679) TaxID=1081104 RepID=A0A167R000_CORFA|nr:hypothetical protein ISF_06682 [Cordyceps fumosorosea ARSEF 2679]OAA58143.1 hypothetical protein ISF_06682 [Cordyceps fumosorosea ARSEF 2679]